MFRAFTLCITAVLVLASPSFADETSSGASVQAGYGTVTIGDVQWQRLSFRPDIPIGKFGMGLDLELLLDNTGKISSDGWDFSSESKSWDTVLRKIYYVRYGKPSDKFFIRAGALDNVTLGYGLIMDGYRNTLNYPGDKKVGLQFALRDVGTFGLGVEGMVNSFGDLQYDGAVVGMRVSARPFKPSGMPILKKVTIGATAVRDVNQYAGLKDSDDDGYADVQDGFADDDTKWADTDGDGIDDGVDIDADGDNILDSTYGGADTDVTLDTLTNIQKSADGVTVYGFDAGIPLLEGKVKLDLYAQYAKIHTGSDADSLDGGWGTGAPGIQLLVSTFTARLEYRHFEGRFLPAYFNNIYENERAVFSGSGLVTKDATLTDNTLNGFFGLASYEFFGLVTAQASYQRMSGDSSTGLNKTYQDLTGKVKLTDKLLSQVPKISLVEGYFYNTNVDVDEYGLLDLTPNTFYGTRLGIDVSSSMTVVWDTRYTFESNGKGGLVRNRFVGIETQFAVK